MKRNFDSAETFPPQEQGPVESEPHAAELDVPDFPDFTEEAGIAEEENTDTSKNLSRLVRQAIRATTDSGSGNGNGEWWRMRKAEAVATHDSECPCMFCGMRIIY